MGVAAEVIDIEHDQPRGSDVFLVDTNVWFWQTYTGASQGAKPPRSYQSTSYPRYVKKALQARAKLWHHDLMFAELAHLIERVECDIFARTFPGASAAAGTATLPIKQFRNQPTQRAQVLAEIEDSWKQVQRMSGPLNWTLHAGCSTMLLATLRSSRLDAYDAAYVLDAGKAGVMSILSDDSDFASVAGLQIFTANRRMIQEARKAGRLSVR